MKATPGPALQSLSTVLENLANNVIAIKTMENADKHFHDDVQVTFCESLVSKLQNRFPDLPIISSFSIFDRNNLTEDPSYGFDQLETLCKH